MRGGGALARRGLARGALSRSFSLAELAAALDDPPRGNVYVEPDGAGGLWSRGGAAALAVAARLAPAAAARGAELGATRRGSGLRLRLRLVADVPPLHELLLWPDAATLAALDMPFLTPLNISGSKNYICHKCRMEFEDPNPLKVHLLLDCREYTFVDFWKYCLAKFETMTAPVNEEWSHVQERSPRVAAAWPAPASPAELEALAAAWGRSADGHVCVYCGKLYSRKYGLKIHIRTHTGYKPLRCRHCLRAFGDPSNLNKHVRLHAQARGGAGGSGGAGAGGGGAPHACAQCGAALARRRDLERHVRARHPEAAALHLHRSASPTK
ncbi:uncharacterized protein Prdm13 [Epargyreus clarus]|uniref:uncharacterized protein Prdm13 n=1 Tax=Epargyreus clarus TaxID=520877 RepID=UPI003C2ADA08